MRAEYTRPILVGQTTCCVYLASIERQYVTGYRGSSYKFVSSPGPELGESAQTARTAAKLTSLLFFSP